MDCFEGLTHRELLLLRPQASAEQVLRQTGSDDFHPPLHCVGDPSFTLFCAAKISASVAAVKCSDARQYVPFTDLLSPCISLSYMFFIYFCVRSFSYLLA